MTRNVLLLLGSCLLLLKAYAAPIPTAGLPEGNYSEFCNGCGFNDDNLFACFCPMLVDGNEAGSADDPDASGGTETLETDTRASDSAGIEFYLQTIDLTLCESLTVVFSEGYLLCDNADENDIESVRGTEEDQVVADNGEVISEPEGVKPENDSASTDDNQEQVLIEKAVIPEPDPEMQEMVNQGELPRGDYINYCRNCRIEDGRLACECDTGAWFSSAKATIGLDSCGPSDSITYHRGTLMCQQHFERISSSFGGCSDCTVNGNSVSCDCNRTPCQWSREDINKGRRTITSTLGEFRFCLSRIVNCNGQLRCGGCGLFDYHEEYNRPYEGTVAGEYCHHVPEVLRSVEDFFLLRWLRQ